MNSAREPRAARPNPGRGALIWTWLATVGAAVVVGPWLYLLWDDELSEGSDQPSPGYFLFYLALYLAAAVAPLLIASVAAYVGWWRTRSWYVVWRRAATAALLAGIAAWVTLVAVAVWALSGYGES